MNRSSDYILPFLLTLTLHASGVYYAGSYLSTKSRVVSPQFASGQSSMELTLLQPAIISKQSEESPVFEDLEIDDESPRRVIEEIETQKEPPNRDADADLLAKGVEGIPVAQTFVRPRYPYGSKIRGEQGTVILCITLDAYGKARAVNVVESSGYRSLDNAAMKAARETVYVSTSGGSVAGREVECKFRFELKD